MGEAIGRLLVRAIAASASFACRAARVFMRQARYRSRSGTDPPVTVHVRLAAGAEPAPFFMRTLSAKGCTMGGQPLYDPMEALFAYRRGGRF